MKKKLVSVLIASGVLLSNSSCDNRVRKEENAMLVRLHKVETNGCTDTSKIPGRVNASEEVNLAFKVSGTLRQVFVKEGDRISEGQLVAEIDPRDYQLQFDAVEAEYLKVRRGTDSGRLPPNTNSRNISRRTPQYTPPSTDTCKRVISILRRLSRQVCPFSRSCREEIRKSRSTSPLPPICAGMI